MALQQFLEYHFDGSEAKLRFFLEQPVTVSLGTQSPPERAGDNVEDDIPVEETKVRALAFGLAEPLPDAQE